MAEEQKKIINIEDLFTEADESLKEFIFRILTDYISIEDIIGDIIAINFSKQEKISEFQGIILTRLSFHQKFQILEQILKIIYAESEKIKISKKIDDFVKYRNMISHRKRGFSISKDGLTLYLDRYKDNKIQEEPVTETKRNEIEKLGSLCCKELTEIREEMKKKFYKNDS